MPSILRRFAPPAPPEEPMRAEQVQALMAHLEAGTSGRPIRHREFRDLIRGNDRSLDEAWKPIRAASRMQGGR